MRNKYSYKICVTLLLSLLIFSVESFSQITYSETVSDQRGRKTKTYSTTGSQSAFQQHWQIGVGFGPTVFFGDVKQHNYAPKLKNKNEIRYGVDLTLGYKLSPVFGIRGMLLYAHVAGSNRNITRYFYSDIIEYTLNTEINLSNIFSYYNSNRFLDFNVILGIGMSNFKSRTRNWTTGAVFESGYKVGTGINSRTLEAVLLAGFALDFRLSNNAVLRLESVLRGMDSDLMDGVENVRFKYDTYNHTSLKFIYKFGKRMKKVTEVPYSPDPVKERHEPLNSDANQNDPNKDNQPINRVIDFSDLYVVPEEVIVERETQEIPITIEEPVYEKPQYTGIEYRVQIRARYGKQIAIGTLSQQYNISASEIQQSMHNGYYIYTVGSFQTYEQARQHCEVVRSRHHVHDAFVVAFENGFRLNKLP